MKTVSTLIPSIFILLAGCSKMQDKIIQPATVVYSETDESSVSTIFGTTGVTKKSLMLPASDDFAHIPQDPKNPLTIKKVQLGQLLFHETRLGGNPKNIDGIYTYSCATCHHAEAGFQSGLAQALGEGGYGFGLKGEGRKPSPTSQDLIDLQNIRTPTVLNAAFQEVTIWNGGFGATGLNVGTEYAWKGAKFSFNNLGYQGVETQAIFGIAGHNFKVDTAWFKANVTYKNLFDLAFSGLPAKQRISPTTVGLAIAAYERTLLSNQSPFQKWLKGDTTAMSADELAGARLFFGKAGCVNCHSGPALNSMKFAALGISDLANGVGGAIRVVPGSIDTKGRGGFTGRDSDMFKFKVPQLYNLKDVNFFGHGSSFTSVADVVRYINKAVSQNSKVPESQLAPQFAPLQLTENEISKITKFIEVSLYDPNLIRYEPVSVPSGNCIPNNDRKSRIDRGCQ